MNSFRLVSFASLLCSFGLTLPATGQEYNVPASRHEVSSDGTTAPGLNLNIPPESVSPAQSNQLNSREFQPEITDEGSITDEYPFPIEPMGDFGSELESHPMLDRPLDFTLGTTDAVAHLPPVFVHARQTVPLSDRTAEIWVKFPANSCSKISVNFVEYSAQGDFSIIRTRLSKNQRRRYYIAVQSFCQGISEPRTLTPMVNSTVLQNEAGMYFVDLRPGERVLIHFLSDYDCPDVKQQPARSVAAPGTKALPQIKSEGQTPGESPFPKVEGTPPAESGESRPEIPTDPATPPAPHPEALPVETSTTIPEGSGARLTPEAGE